MTMNRREKEITDSAEIADIMRRAQICRVAMMDGAKPYIVPVNFVVAGDHLYFHCARRGKKIDILRSNTNVCFQMDVDTEIIAGKNPCDWGMKYLSVIGYGRAFFVTDAAQKVKVLNKLMGKYAGAGSYNYPEEIIQKTMIVGVAFEKLTGKKSPLP
ncbi:MAG TPA: pyridoxamine 5'-phosphate oxidase family protein [Smithellaceae bacterium]|nr:pyridoxamine 5'-phosphate oxidase family protein [Smithellaceae bacterium]HRS89453.1 pyridoxamine 5'-phosphate oxidase family protein [Smithellaceae bacterium]HRV26402.1 pyridoxamine 5'-phosphate oxidase family protein [Smithellaceae bacterium]